MYVQVIPISFSHPAPLPLSLVSDILLECLPIWMLDPICLICLLSTMLDYDMQQKVCWEMH